ncbi:MAG: asparagine synthase (glutamine-hydrolyzing) [Pseudomonadota bacterium]|nr:asparagine synthase (glutamine-hydrolyzing) [Pseudomonadota bacterium]
MCGIGGYFLRPGAIAPADALDRMERALGHRGPDGSGRFTNSRAGFVHTRLSIVDLAKGAQPFIAPAGEGGQVLIANGEIYNHAALRQSHCGGYEFTSNSDCETVLALWARHGHAALTQLRGMYAAALHDPGSGEGLLIRDAFGIKPLYVCETAHGLFFASEITALRAIGLAETAPERAAPDPLHAACIIDRQFAPDDLPAFPAIRRVAPGAMLVIRDGQIADTLVDAPLEASFADPATPTTGAFEMQLHDSVEAHLMADVPLGLFFSGGVDSSAILAALADLRSRDGHAETILTYTVRFDHGSDDETAMAAALAADEGADFVDVPYGKADFLADAGLAALACDDAVADYAILPTLHLARRAARDVKVVLSGEGGDEFFAGYGRYRAGLRAIGAKFPTRPGPALRADLFDNDVTRRLAARYGRADAAMPGVLQRLADRRGALAALQRHDIDDWLPNDLLIKLDRCLMRHGLEGRTPFIDRRLSPFGFHLPVAAKIRTGGGKHLVKSWLAERMPACRPFARKRGFTVPVGGWIAEESGTLAPLVATQDGVAELMRADAARAVISSADGHGHGRGGLLAWRLLFYALWHQIHCRGVSAEQPLAEILAARP